MRAVADGGAQAAALRGADGPGMRVVEPPTGLSFPDLKELWHYRDLVYFLVHRDIAVRYKQTSVGVLWAILQPVVFAVVFSVFLGLLAKIRSPTGLPYPVFALSGLTLWLYFTQAVQKTSDSTVSSANLISKVYFPRIIIPLSAVMSPTVNLIPAFVVVLATMLIYGIVPAATVLLVPLAVLLAMVTALGIGLWLSALHVKYRDVALIVPTLIQAGMFMTPIVYPFDLVPESYQPLYALNPMVGVLEAYRWMLFPSADWPGMIVLIPIVMSVVLLITGALYFQRAERDFADII